MVSVIVPSAAIGSLCRIASRNSRRPIAADDGFRGFVRQDGWAESASPATNIEPDGIGWHGEWPEEFAGDAAAPAADVRFVTRAIGPYIRHPMLVGDVL